MNDTTDDGEELDGSTVDTSPAEGGTDADGGGLSRRATLGLIGGGVVAAGAAAFGVSRLSGDDPAPAVAAPVDDVVDFYGAHQAGIVTPAQDRLHFAAFDVVTQDRAALVALLKTWTDAAARMTAGLEVGTDGAVGGPLEAPPEDTGEAIGLSPAQLTITIGFGPSLFVDAAGRDRFGLAHLRPAGLAELPHFPNEAIDPSISNGDLCIQACSNDPQVAVHAVRNLARLGFGTVAVRWSQLGFGRTSSTSTAQATPRNLFGFKDGTANLKAEDPIQVDQHVWVQPGDGPEWLAGGSYLVSRRIRMNIETWDRTPLLEQQQLVGRTKGEGGPMSGGTEFSALRFDLPAADGQPAVGLTSHVRLSHPDFNNGAQLLRRGYNFVDGSDGFGRLDAGLFFLAFQRDPRTHFVPIQTKLSAQDGLNEYLRHVSSGLFAVPPGVTTGGYWGQQLFA